MELQKQWQINGDKILKILYKKNDGVLKAKKTVYELFAGVGCFRCGLNHIKTLKDLKKQQNWETVWFNQWEPAD